MEHRYLETKIGKVHAVLITPMMFLVALIYAYDYSQGKSVWGWGFLLSLVGFAFFLKAKLSVIRTKKLISWGCDLMDQKHTYYYFFGWVLMVGGYFLSFRK